jgi:hypothetical protein
MRPLVKYRLDGSLQSKKKSSTMKIQDAKFSVARPWKGVGLMPSFSEASLPSSSLYAGTSWSHGDLSLVA